METTCHKRKGKEKMKNLLDNNEELVNNSQETKRTLDKLSKLLKVPKDRVQTTIQNLVDKVEENKKEIERLKDPNYEPYKFDVKTNVITEDGVWIFAAKIDDIKDANELRRIGEMIKNKTEELGKRNREKDDRK